MAKNSLFFSTLAVKILNKSAGQLSVNSNEIHRKKDSQGVNEVDPLKTSPPIPLFPASGGIFNIKWREVHPALRS